MWIIWQASIYNLGWVKMLDREDREHVKYQETHEKTGHSASLHKNERPNMDRLEVGGSVGPRLLALGPAGTGFEIRFYIPLPRLSVIQPS